MIKFTKNCKTASFILGLIAKLQYNKIIKGGVISKEMIKKNMKWKDKVRNLMDEKNINQKKMSELSGITESSVCRYLKGDRTPRIDIVVNFAKALDVEVDYLLDEEKVLNPFESVKQAIARYGNDLTEEEQEELVNLLLGKE